MAVTDGCFDSPEDRGQFFHCTNGFFGPRHHCEEGVPFFRGKKAEARGMTGAVNDEPPELRLNFAVFAGAS